jgi:hypothetical protein
MNKLNIYWTEVMNSAVICSVRNKILVERCTNGHAKCPVRDIIWSENPFSTHAAYLTARPVAWKHSFSTNIKSLTGLSSATI